jgi:GNAT superfamily N-acetyltransferase
MSLFLQTLILRGISFREQEHHQERVGVGMTLWPTASTVPTNMRFTFLMSLPEKQREQLTSAMGQVERLLEASMIHLAIEDPTSTDAIWCFDQYFAELNSRFEAGFDPTRSISAEAQELVPPRGALVIARLRGQPVGCGAVKFAKKRVAELKRMWVCPTLRGLGVGRRVMNELERLASEANVHLVRLETNRTLQEAIRLYRSAGYVEVDALTPSHMLIIGSKSDWSALRGF